jgi:hypothetical protein
VPQGLCTICLSTSSSAAFRAAPDVSAAASFLVPLAHATTGLASSFPVRGARAAAKRGRGGGLKDDVKFSGGEAVDEGDGEVWEDDEIDDPALSRSGARNKPFREEDVAGDIPVSAAPTLYVISHQPRGSSSLDDDEITHSTISYTASGVSIADVQDIALVLSTLVSAPPVPPLKAG